MNSIVNSASSLFGLREHHQVQSVREIQTKFVNCCSNLSKILDVSTKLKANLVNKPTWEKPNFPEWQQIQSSLISRCGDKLDIVSQSRWEVIVFGWLPLIQELCVVVEQLRMADKKLKPGERAPLDMISLHTICVIHCGLELIVQWGISSRLDSAGYGGLCRRMIKPLSQTSVKLLKLDVDEKGSYGRDGSALFTPVLHKDTHQSMEFIFEPRAERDMRICICSIVIEKCLNIAQIRSLLLPRYYPHLIISFMGLSYEGGNYKTWADLSLTHAFIPASVNAEVDSLDVASSGGGGTRDVQFTTGGLSIAVKSLRELSSCARGALGSEVGGLLSAALCLEGGLDAILDLFVGPVNASQ